MTATVLCGECGVSFECDDALPGTKGVCPECVRHSMIEFAAPKPRSCNHVNHDPLKPTARCGGPAMCDRCFDELMKLPAGNELDEWVERFVFGGQPPAAARYSIGLNAGAIVAARAIDRHGHCDVVQDGDTYVCVIGKDDPAWQARGETPGLATCRAAVFAFRKG